MPDSKYWSAGDRDRWYEKRRIGAQSNSAMIAISSASFDRRGTSRKRLSWIDTPRLSADPIAGMATECVGLAFERSWPTKTLFAWTARLS